MSQTTEPAAEPPSPGELPHRHERSDQLGKAAAWVGIVAGVVFVVGVIFSAGFWLGHSQDGYGGHFGRPPGHMTSSDMSNSCPMMRSTSAPEAPHHSG